MQRAGNRETERFFGMLRRVSDGDAFFSRFMDPREQEQCRASVAQAGLPYQAWGGFEDAERRMVCASIKRVEEAAYPMVCLRISWRRGQDAPAHRDILGALMSLGMERSCFGDIVPGEGAAYLAATETAAALVLAEMRAAGGSDVTVETGAFDEAVSRAGLRMTINIPSARLDALLQSALKLPRSSAQTLVAQGRVKLNHAETRKSDAPLKEGDVVSVRGFGRVRVTGFAGESRKGRLFLDIEVFS